MAIGIAVAAKAAAPDGLVDLNTASFAELMRLPGVTTIWAQRIVRYRPYQSKLDLVNQGVVSENVYLRIRDRVVAHRAKTVK